MIFFLKSLVTRAYKKLTGREHRSVYSRRSYSQDGEDLILARLFENKQKGFYVDVGAHHPMRFSNTYYFYERGWRGINIDPIPGMTATFSKVRPHDINLELGISETKEEIGYHIFSEPAFNTFSTDRIKEVDGVGSNCYLRTIQVPTAPLASILGQYLTSEQRIDFMSVDVEGVDLIVLRSGNWELYRPAVVLVEHLGGRSLEEELNSEVAQFMRNVGYILYGRAVNTLFFVDSDMQGKQL